MDQPPDPEPRIASLERRVDRVEAQTAVARHDAAAARHLAAEADRDVSEHGIKIDALRKALNAHAEQTAGGFTEMRREFEVMRTEMRTEMRTGFAKAAVGQQLIVDLLTREDRD